MPYQWPADTDFFQWELEVVDRDCAVCGRKMYVCDHRYRRLHTLEGPARLPAESRFGLKSQDTAARTAEMGRVCKDRSPGTSVQGGDKLKNWPFPDGH